MKNVSLFIALLLTATLFAQHPQKVNLHLKLYDANEIIAPGVKIKLVDMGSRSFQNMLTNKKGIASFKVYADSTYALYVLDTVAITSLKIPTGKSYFTKKITIHSFTAPFLAANNKVDTIDQNRLQQNLFNTGDIQFSLSLFEYGRRSVSKVPVSLFNEDAQTIYTSTTNSKGVASFFVPGNTELIVGVDGLENYDTLKTSSTGLFNKSLAYYPAKVKETRSNDTIYLENNTALKPSTKKALVNIELLRYADDVPLANEWIFFDNTTTQMVYAVKTDYRGRVRTQVPNGTFYTINFKYQRNSAYLYYPLDFVNYTATYHLFYIGSSIIEDFMKKAKYKNGFATEFLEPDIKIVPNREPVLHKIETGFEIEFDKNSSVLTPAYYENHLIFTDGFYGRHVYCLNIETQDYKWKISLAEGGPSVMVIENGILLINTESCTLYAIDIESGKLLWSKYISHFLSHSPTAHNNVVYAVHDQPWSKVLAAFDLYTGTIKWQSFLNKSPLGAPIYAAGNVYLTSTDGYLFSFDATSGELLNKKELNDIGLPTIVNNNIWLTANKTGQPTLNTYSNALEYTNTLNIKLNTSPSKNYISTSLSMSYSINRPIIDGNTCYLKTKKELIAYNLKNNKELWRIEGTMGESGLALANGYLVAQIKPMEIAVIKKNSGKIIKRYAVEAPSSEPVLAKGWIFYGTKKGKLLGIDTGLEKLDGWYQWGKTATHNTSF